MQVTEVLIIALTKKERREELYCSFYLTNDMNFFKKKKEVTLHIISKHYHNLTMRQHKLSYLVTHFLRK